jgi:hypothetical protein
MYFLEYLVAPVIAPANRHAGVEESRKSLSLFVA